MSAIGLRTPLELEAIVGAVIELGEIVGVQMPNIRAVYAGTKLLGESVAKGRTTRAFEDEFVSENKFGGAAGTRTPYFFNARSVVQIAPEMCRT